MDRKEFLKELAVTGYNVLYAAKKHFATFDIVEKAPGWITILTLGIGVFGLVIERSTINLFQRQSWWWALLRSTSTNSKTVGNATPMPAAN